MAITKNSIRNPRVLTVFKTSNQIKNSDTSFANDNDLVLSVNPNEKFSYYIVLSWSSGATPDIKFQLSLPSGSTHDMVNLTDLTNLNKPIVLPGSGSNEFAILVGEFTVGSTGGIVGLQWAKNTSNAGNTVVNVNSYMIFTKLN